MRIADESPLRLIAITRGDAWLVPDNDEALLLGPGEVAVIRGPDPYTLADDPGRPPQAIVLPGRRGGARVVPRLQRSRRGESAAADPR